jgi:cell division protease FtsH
VFLGRDWLRADPAYSQETGNRIDAQVQQLARTALDQAVALLAPRRPLIDALVQELIEQETIEGPAFTAIVERFESVAPSASATGQPSGEADVETAQVGVQAGILNR